MKCITNAVFLPKKKKKSNLNLIMNKQADKSK